MKNILFIAFVLLTISLNAQITATLQGKVTDKESGEVLLYANISVYKDGNLVVGGQTDFDGNYSITQLDPGTYDVVVSNVFYISERIENVVLFAGKITKVVASIRMENCYLRNPCGFYLYRIAYKLPLIQADNTTNDMILTAQKIEKLPHKSIEDLISNYRFLN